MMRVRLFMAFMVVLSPMVLAFLILTPILMVTTQEQNEMAPILQEGKIRVIATIFPLYDFARNLGGEMAEVSLLIPPGVEIHNWEPSPQDLRRIRGAKILVYNGAALEPWIDSLRESLDTRDVLFVDASREITKLSGNGRRDPHVWLDPLNAKTQVLSILRALEGIDPENEEYYRDNAETYMAKLDDLDREIVRRLEMCKLDTFISLHEAYWYFTSRYRLTGLALLKMGEEEPSARDIANLIVVARERNITVIYSEPLQDPRLADELSKNIPNSTVMLLDPAEEVSIKEITAGETFISIMRQNLESLTEGLACER